MRQLIAIVAVALLSQNVLFAAGPLEQAAAVGGTALMLWGMNRCENLGGTIRQCTESQSLTWLGVGVAGAGAALLGVGVTRHSDVRVLPSSIVYRVRF